MSKDTIKCPLSWTINPPNIHIQSAVQVMKHPVYIERRRPLQHCGMCIK